MAPQPIGAPRPQRRGAAAPVRASAARRTCAPPARPSPHRPRSGRSAGSASRRCPAREPPPDPLPEPPPSAPRPPIPMPSAPSCCVSSANGRAWDGVGMSCFSLTPVSERSSSPPGVLAGRGPDVHVEAPEDAIVLARVELDVGVLDRLLGLPALRGRELVRQPVGALQAERLRVRQGGVQVVQELLDVHAARDLDRVGVAHLRLAGVARIREPSGAGRCRARGRTRRPASRPPRSRP